MSGSVIIHMPLKNQNTPLNENKHRRVYHTPESDEVPVLSNDSDEVPMLSSSGSLHSEFEHSDSEMSPISFNSNAQLSIHDSDSSGSVMQAPKSELDRHRDTAPWSNNFETQIRIWQEDCKVLAVSHERQARYFNKIAKFIAFTSSLISMTLTVCQTSQIVVSSIIQALALFTISVMTGIIVVFNPATRSERHHNFANNYSELHLEITGEMTKPRQFRSNVQTFSLKTMDKYNSLNVRAPNL